MFIFNFKFILVNRKKLKNLRYNIKNIYNVFDRIVRTK